MKRNLWRLLLALVISCGCFMGTVIWYRTGLHRDDADTHQPPVARLSSAVNEVQRKPVRRVIWESISRNDELYPGEAIRTAPNAEANIQFVKSGTIVHLDPDSLIVLDRNNQGLSLDFLQGNLFVQGDKSASDGLTLKTGDSEIDLKSAAMSLSKGQNGQVDLQVFHGQAELRHGGKNVALDQDKSAVLSANGLSQTRDALRLLEPSAGETVFLNLNRGEKLALKWKPLPAGYSMSVEVGASRSDLQPQTAIAAEGEAGRLLVPTSPGRWFLRVIATPKDPKLPRLASLTIPFVIQPESPPVLLEPSGTAPVLKASPHAPVSFRWMNRHHFTSQVLQIARDNEFRQAVERKNLDGTTATLTTQLTDGRYFWRVTGFLRVRGKLEALTSDPIAFAARSNWQISPPTLKAPADQLHLSYLDVQKHGLHLKWTLPPDVKKFQVSVKKHQGESWTTILDNQTAVPFAELSDLQPGEYEWRVSSLDSKGGAPKPSSPFHFVIESLPPIHWTKTAPQTEYDFTTPTPSLAAAWHPVADLHAKYRFKIAPSDQDLKTAKWHSTREPSFDVPVASEGHFTATVQAVDDQGKVLAQTETKDFLVKRAPLLPAPKWTSDTPDVLKASAKGDLSFGWQPVDGAQKYLLILKSPKGSVLQKAPVSRTTASLRRMKPGEYQVFIQSVDSHQRPGPESDGRTIQVPAKSDIRAPTIHVMKVK